MKMPATGKQYIFLYFLTSLLLFCLPDTNHFSRAWAGPLSCIPTWLSLWPPAEPNTCGYMHLYSGASLYLTMSTEISGISSTLLQLSE